MNTTDTNLVSINITTMPSLSPRSVGSVNTVTIALITHINTHRYSYVSRIDLQPFQTSSSSSSSISQFLHHNIDDTQVSDIVAERIFCDTRSLPEPFMLILNVELRREVQITSPSPSVSTPSRSSWNDVVNKTHHGPLPPDVLYKLREEQRVGPMELKEEEKVACSICMDNLTENHANITRLPHCLHLFHENCVFEWFKRNNSCPMCRSIPFEEKTKLNETITETQPSTSSEVLLNNL